MPIYILLTNLTDEGSKTLKNNPSRIKEVNQEVEGFGVRVVAQYAALGPYDFVNIVEGRMPKRWLVFRLNWHRAARCGF